MIDAGLVFDRLHADACAGRPAGATIAAEFIARTFGPVSEGPIYLSSLPNSEDRAGEPGERHLLTRDQEEIGRWMLRWDRPKRGAYFCVAALRPGADRRAKETVGEIVLLHADVDFKGIDAPPAEITVKLGQVRLPASLVVSSGHGLHLYWLLREAIEATPEAIERVEAALRQLCDHVGGDRQCCEVSRLMRLPGGHNSKNGEWLDVEIIADRSAARYELDEIEEWLAEVAPLIRRKDEAPADDINPWLAVAATLGFKPPVDVEQRLAAMRYGGVGDAGIHNTQLSVTAALLTRGIPIADAVALVLDATRAAAGEHGKHWSWAREERAIRGMCDTWLAKHPAPAADQQATGTDDIGVVSLADKRAERERDTKAKAGKKKPSSRDAAVAIADGVIKIVRDRGLDLLLTGGELLIYEAGVWRVADGADVQRLRCLIQQGCESLGEGAKLGVVHASWKRLVEHPALYRESVPWDRRGLVALANGVLDLKTRKFSAWDPEHYLRRKLAAAYDATARCPEFIGFLSSLFADRDPPARQATVALLQEFFGASLGVGLLNRESRRALLLKGPSRTGKTELAGIIRKLVGEPVASPAIADISERFGTATFHGASAWIRDDAINEGDKINPERFKTIVTGEPIDIERKNSQPIRQVRLEIPVALTANTLPTSRDSSDAIFNRCLVVEMVSIFEEEAAVETRRRLGVPAGTSVGAWIFGREASGILNWALDGLARLTARGRYEVPRQVVEAIREFKENNNPVWQWTREMLIKSDTTKVERGDLLCAFHGWWREEMGDDVRLLGGRWLMPRLRDACPWVTPVKVMGTRYFGGIRLNDEGLKYWERQSSDAAQRGHGAKGTSTEPKAVNKPWNETPDLQ